MTPHSANSPPAPPLLHFVLGEDGRYLAGPYVLAPGKSTAGFGIELMDVFCEGVHVHRSAGRLRLEDAIAWAREHAAAHGLAHKGQQALI
jgi:hypothetical protein